VDAYVTGKECRLSLSACFSRLAAPGRPKRWVPSQRDRVLLKDTGVVRTRRDDAATVEQVIKGIPGKPRYYVLDTGKLERLLRKGPSRS
jgi:hypothetical protein